MADRPHPALRASRPLVFAHRGGAALAPENTVAAFDLGLALGADGLELDVRLSRDGVAVVLHDATLDRTTDASGPLSRHTAAELARLDAAYHFRPGDGYPLRGKGITVPRLCDVLARYRDIPLIVELKGPDPAVARVAIDEIRAAGACDRICLGGFSRRVLRAARAYDPRVATGAARDELRWAQLRFRLPWPLLNPPYRALHVPHGPGRPRVLSPRFVEFAHRSGVVVQPWTVDEADDIRELIRWGVDGVMTDRPDVAARVAAETTTSDARGIG